MAETDLAVRTNILRGGVMVTYGLSLAKLLGRVQALHLFCLVRYLLQVGLCIVLFAMPVRAETYTAM